MPSLLSDRVCEQVVALPTLNRFDRLREEMALWVKHRALMWEPLVVEVCASVEVDVAQASAERVVAAWLVLMAASSPLDAYVDGDVAQESAWLMLGRDAGTFVALALINDALLLLLEGCAEVSACQALMAGIRNTCLGQVLDIEGVQSIEAYDGMVELKSSAIFLALVEALAALGSGAPGVLDAWREFGKWLGIAVQVMNDYRGIRGIDQLGKVTGGDLRGVAMTYPILYGLHGSYARRDEFVAQLQLPGDQRDVELMWDILDEKGVRHFMGLILGQCRTAMAASLQVFDQNMSERVMGWYDSTFLQKAGE